MNLNIKTKNIKEKGAPTGTELDYLAAALGTRFIRRWDLYSKQRGDGRYLCVRERLHHDHLLDHLQGEITLGAYVLDEDSLGVYLVFDGDDNPDWRRLQALAVALKEDDTPTYLEKSRRGGHLWLFFDEALSGENIRRFGQGLMIHFGLGSLELFPKQKRVSGGPGSLIRLPFGVHRKSGRRYGFYTADGQPLAPTLREQIHLLEKPQTVSTKVIERFSQFAPSEKRRRAGSSKHKRTGESDPPMFERIKQRIPVREFVRRYVDLSSNGSGLCPFHDDHVDSFSVNEERNYWKCFACGKSGSIIDFWMYYRDCDFNTAVKQLTGMLL